MLQPRWLSSWSMLSAVAVYLTFQLSGIHGATVVQPVVEVFEVKRENVANFDDNQSMRMVNISRNSDLFFGQDTASDSALLLKCHAPYSVQWVFRGDSNPEFNTNTTKVELRDASDLYSAYLYLGSRRNLNERETGKYICTSVRNKRMQSYLYIFVTGGALFTNKGLETIQFSDKDDSIRIPCSLSEPRATATLQKSQDGVLKCPMNDSVRFDAKQGFLLNPKKLQHPQGSYLCIADYNNKFQIIKYNLVKYNETNSELTSDEDFEKPHEPSEFEPTHAPPQSSQRPTSSPSPGGTTSNLLCTHGSCGKNAACIKNKHGDSVCRCYEGYYGNPYVECVHESQTTTFAPPQQDPTTSVPSSNDGCITNNDCPYDRACIQNSCQDPCRVPQTICGANTYCNHTANHIPQCQCKEGFTGDPYSSQEGQRCENSHCNPNPCGLNTYCNYVNGIISCSCKPGYSTSHDGVCHPNQKHPNQEFPDPDLIQSTAIVGSHPKRPSHGGIVAPSSVFKKECHFDTDCPDDKMCIQDKCENPCVNACGVGATCHTRNHFPRCVCPEGTSGDPFYKCTPLFSEILSSSNSASDMQSNIRDVVDCGGANSPCGPNTICQASRKFYVCACPNNFEGDPYSSRGCYKSTGHQKCQRDEDCPHFLTCLRHQGCVNPCSILNVCQPDRSCVAHLHRPLCLKTASYDWGISRTELENQPEDRADEFGQQELLESLKDGATSRKCFIRSGDSVSSPCGKGSYCHDVSGEAFCGCRESFNGDPYHGCEQRPQGNETCKDGQCVIAGNETNPCFPTPCMSLDEKCVIVRSNQSALCLPLNESIASSARDSESEAISKLNVVLRSDALCIDGSCEDNQEDDFAESNEEIRSTTDLAYYTVIPTSASDLASSSASSFTIEDISTPPVHVVDTFNYSNESAPVSNDEDAVVDE